MQTVMRHSVIKLTLDRYGHLFPKAEADAVTRLRSAFSQPLKLRATGASDLQVNYSETRGLQIGVQSGFNSMRQGVKQCHYDEKEGMDSDNEKTPYSQGKYGDFIRHDQMRAEGLEPSTQGLKVLCSTD